MIDFYNATLVFLASIISSLAWPLLLGVVLYMVYLGRDFIKETISRVVKIKYKDIEMSFNESLISLSGQAAGIGIDIVHQPQEVYKTILQEAKDSAIQNPQAAIASAFIALSTILRSAMEKIRPDLLVLDSPFDALDKTPLFSKEISDFLKQLRKTGSNIICQPSNNRPDISPEEALNYISLVEGAIKKIEQIMDKNMDT